MTGFLPQRTIKYKTYVKTALTEAFGAVFAHHVDEILRGTKVTIDYPRTEAAYPALLIRFFERDIQNAGVGHEEWLVGDGSEDTTNPNHYKFKHYLYHGDVEFAIYALSSLDRDLIADTVVQTLGMGQLEDYTNRFFDRIYPDESSGQIPDSVWHYINLNTDTIQGFGESQTAVPWGSEDDLTYMTSYRIPVFGEFYSVPPDTPTSLIAKITQYPYIQGVEDVPTGDPDDGAQWEPPLPDPSALDDDDVLSEIDDGV